MTMYSILGIGYYELHTCRADLIHMYLVFYVSVLSLYILPIVF